eukprot:6198358-Pleurochrysis_carterae.AAC.4
MTRRWRIRRTTCELNLKSTVAQSPSNTRAWSQPRCVSGWSRYASSVRTSRLFCSGSETRAQQRHGWDCAIA